MSKPRFTHDGWDARSYDLGAARERRKIRRAQRRAVMAIWNTRRHHPPGCPCQWCALYTILDAATRSATRGKR